MSENLRSNSVDVSSELALALYDIFSIDIRVERRDGRVVDYLHVDRVLTHKPTCIGWVIVENSELAARTERRGWTLWRPDLPIETRKGAGVVPASDLSVFGTLVATLREPEVACRPPP